MRRRPRTRPPAALLSTLDTLRGERILAWATGTDGSWYVGSTLALHLPRPDGGHRRLRWEEIERADWQSDSDRLAVVEVAEWGAPERTTLVDVADSGHLLELVRERVTKSVVLSLYARVRGSAGLSVIGRRTPSGAGPVTWSYVLSSGLDPADPVVVAVAEATLEQARREVDGL